MTAIADLGGLYAVTMAIFAVIYWVLAEPYRELHLAVSFNRMKNQICRTEGMIPQSSGIDEQYEASLGLLFNLFLFINKRMPSCFSICFFKDNSRGKITFSQMVRHYDELT